MSVGSSSTVVRVASEDEAGQKWDRCFSDMILKTGLFTSVSREVCIILINAHRCVDKRSALDWWELCCWVSRPCFVGNPAAGLNLAGSVLAPYLLGAHSSAGYIIVSHAVVWHARLARSLMQR